MAVRDKPSARSAGELQQIRAQLLEALTVSQITTIYFAIEYPARKPSTEEEKSHQKRQMH